VTRRPGRLRLVHTAERKRARGGGLDCNPYGLTPRELRAEIARCIDAGWRGWEIAARFDCIPCKDSSE